jgi:hypothetical protein
MGLSRGKRTFNGYTPLGHKALQGELCIQERTQTTCPDGIRRWTMPDGDTGAPLLDLFRITEVAAQHGMWRDALAPRLGPGWRSLGRGAAVETFARVDPILLPGTVSWLPRGMQVMAPEAARHQAESLTILANPQGGRLIFARLFWPGYRASLNGDPLPIIAHRGFLVAVDLPPGSTGQLKVWFRPPGLRLGFLLAGLGVVILIAFLWALTRLGSRRIPSRETHPEGSSGSV